MMDYRKIGGKYIPLWGGTAPRVVTTPFSMLCKPHTRERTVAYMILYSRDRALQSFKLARFKIQNLTAYFIFHLLLLHSYFFEISQTSPAWNLSS